MAMKDYTFIRPGIAVTVSAVTLVVALFFGLDLIRSLKRAAVTVQQGAQTTQTLHRYNAGLEVWHQMMASTDPAYRRTEALAQRDSIREALREQLATLGKVMEKPEAGSSPIRFRRVCRAWTRRSPPRPGRRW
jgi:hypothetical protein